MHLRPDAAAWAQTLVFAPMTAVAARTIAENWTYPAPYDFYNGTADAEDYQEFITPALWPDHVWRVLQGQELVGFFTADSTGPTTCEISLGLRPDLTGGGRGLALLRAGLALIATQMDVNRVCLSVAVFNERAIKVYEAAGFVPVRRYEQPTNGSTFDFVDMELSLN